MSFFRRLFPKRPDPTHGWGAFRLPIPDFDLRTMQFGPLRFGAPLQEAAFLGRPDSITWTEGGTEMLYASGGFQIDFDQNELEYAAFFIGPDAHLPKHRALQFSAPRLIGVTPDVFSLSPESDRAFLEKIFGPAESVDTETEEVILTYTRQRITMEFEMGGGGQRLKRWNLYPS